MLAISLSAATLSAIFCAVATAMPTFAVTGAMNLTAPSASRPENLSATHLIPIFGTSTTLQITTITSAGDLNAHNLRTMLHNAEVEIYAKPNLNQPFGGFYSHEWGAQGDAVRLILWSFQRKRPSWMTILHVIDGLNGWAVVGNHPVPMLLLVWNDGNQVASGRVAKGEEMMNFYY